MKREDRIKSYLKYEEEQFHTMMSAYYKMMSYDGKLSKLGAEGEELDKLRERIDHWLSRMHPRPEWKKDT